MNSPTTSNEPFDECLPSNTISSNAPTQPQQLNSNETSKNDTENNRNMDKMTANNSENVQVPPSPSKPTIRNVATYNTDLAYLNDFNKRYQSNPGVTNEDSLRWRNPRKGSDSTRTPQHHHHHHHGNSRAWGNERGDNNQYHSNHDSNSVDAPVAQDSFGNVPYEPQFCEAARNRMDGKVPPLADIPWELRAAGETNLCLSFSFLSQRYFWFLLEYACRVTFIAMLVPAAIIGAKFQHSPFISTTFCLTSVVIAVGTTTGQAMQFCVKYVKGGCIWLPIATACSALKLNRYLAAWFVVFVVVLFLMATFTEGTSRRMCLLLYCISMTNLLNGDESVVYPSRVFSDWGLGALFALVASLLPYPLLATHSSRKIGRKLFRHTATAFTGIINCFWIATNTERSMSMVRVRFLVRQMDHLIDEFDKCDVFTFYEVLFSERFERREVRKEKIKLLFKLKLNLRAMERVINMVQDRPQILDESSRCMLFREHLSPLMGGISTAMESLLYNISASRSYKDLRALTSNFELCGSSIKKLQDEFSFGRRVLFYEDAASLETTRMEEFIPLMTFFVFSIVNFWTTLEEFQSFVDQHKPVHDWKETIKMVFDAVLEPFVTNALFLKNLFTKFQEPEVRIVIEAAKVSVAMLVSVIFFYYVDNQSLLLSGPTIIAFVSGTNPVEAVQASAARLSGTLFGCVIGFFAASLSTTTVDRVVALCVITFVMTFFRTNYSFGTICMYCNFVAVSNLAPGVQTAEQTISRIQQNTFAILIYCFISVVFFPVSPNKVLFEKRIAVMKDASVVVSKLMLLFSEVASDYVPCEKPDGQNGGGNGGAGERPRTIHFNSCPSNINLRSSNLNPDGLPNGSIHIDGVNPTSTIVVNNESRLERIIHEKGEIAKSLIPHAFTMAPQDRVMQLIFADIFKLLDVMKATTKIMPLASEEITVIPKIYPLRATGDIHAALYRVCALVYTMACCWKAMREKGYFTTDVVHVFYNLCPVTTDIAVCLEKYVNILDFYVKHPDSGASSELTKGVMQFRTLCAELSLRKERCLLATIRKTVNEQRINQPKHRHTHHHSPSSRFSNSINVYSPTSVQSPVYPFPVGAQGSANRNEFPTAPQNTHVDNNGTINVPMEEMRTEKNPLGLSIFVDGEESLNGSGVGNRLDNGSRVTNTTKIFKTDSSYPKSAADGATRDGKQDGGQGNNHNNSNNSKHNNSAPHSGDRSEHNMDTTLSHPPFHAKRNDSHLERVEQLRKKARKKSGNNSKLRNSGARTLHSSPTGIQAPGSLPHSPNLDNHHRRFSNADEASLPYGSSRERDLDNLAAGENEPRNRYTFSRSSREGGSDSDSCSTCHGSSYSSSSSTESSLVQFNESFTTPITVTDAEGLHSFTLSLEMLGKELRRALYGFEEMLQFL